MASVAHGRVARQCEAKNCPCGRSAGGSAAETGTQPINRMLVKESSGKDERESSQYIIEVSGKLRLNT